MLRKPRTITTSSADAAAGPNIENKTVERWAARIAAQAGYSDVTHTVELFGLCDRHQAT